MTAAAIITAVAAVLAAVITTVGTVVVARMRAEVRHIGKAVNNVPDNAPPLVERVHIIAHVGDARWHWTHNAIHAIGREVGATLPDPPTEAAA